MLLKSIEKDLPHITMKLILLLKKMEQLNVADEEGNTPLHLAIKNGQINVATKLIECLKALPNQINVKDKEGYTPLHCAIEKDLPKFEIFQGKIVEEIENEFLTNPTKEMKCTYHEKKLDSVYVKLEGWFTEEELSRFIILSIDGIKSKKV